MTSPPKRTVVLFALRETGRSWLWRSPRKRTGTRAVDASAGRGAEKKKNSRKKEREGKFHFSGIRHCLSSPPIILFTSSQGTGFEKRYP